MGLSTALYSTLSGLNGSQQMLEVIGNNIANVNTTGYKSSRINFQTMFSETLSSGSPPSGSNGGSNPMQVGLGAQASSTTRNFSDGSRSTTGVNTDLAIEGNGFFILQGNKQTFTRDGSFQLNSKNQLVSSNGDYVQGYGIDSNYNVVPTTLGNITIPLGTLTVAEATTSVGIAGNMNATGKVPTTVSNISVHDALYLNGSGTTPSATAPTGTDLLTDIVNDTNVAYFQVGDVLTATGKRGDSSVNDVSSNASSTTQKSLTVTATTTMQDYMDYLKGVYGIDSSVGGNGSLADGGVTLQTDASFSSNSRKLVIQGNLGSSNSLSITADDISLLRNGATTHPFGMSQNSTADGEATTTSTVIYDSLGTQVNMSVTMSLVSNGDTGTVWRYYVTSPDSTTGVNNNGVGTNTFVASGILQFNTNGKLVNGDPAPTITIDRSGTGASPLLQFTLDFNEVNSLSANSSKTGNSSLNVATVNGSEKGTLKDFTISNNGEIIGSFDKGQQRVLGQIALATFRNTEGLLDAGNNTYVPGASSGLATITAPGELSAGTIIGSSLELSNVDLSQEFVKMISASTGFSASSRVITTSNQLLQELLQSVR